MAVDRLVWKIILDFVLMACRNDPEVSKQSKYNKITNVRSADALRDVMDKYCRVCCSLVDAARTLLQRLLIMAFSLLAIELWMQPYRRGFFVEDLDIRLPYKDQTVNEIMTSFGVVIVILTILIVEIVRDKQGKGIGEKFICGRLVPGWVWETYCAVGVFLFGLACQHLLTFISKSVIGRLRPHFYDVCMPVYNASDPVNVNGYIVEYTCLQPDERSIREAHMSFPSGHASYAMCCAVYFICYVQVRGKWRGSKMLRHMVQFAVLLAAWYVGLTRVREHFHHWSDVAAGSLTGGIVAAVVFKYILKANKYRSVPRAESAWGSESSPQRALPRPVLAH